MGGLTHVAREGQKGEGRGGMTHMACEGQHVEKSPRCGNHDLRTALKLPDL